MRETWQVWYFYAWPQWTLQKLLTRLLFSHALTIANARVLWFDRHPASVTYSEFGMLPLDWSWEHITGDVGTSLPWLPVPWCVGFKLASLLYKYLYIYISVSTNIPVSWLLACFIWDVSLSSLFFHWIFAPGSESSMELSLPRTKRKFHL